MDAVLMQEGPSLLRHIAPKGRRQAARFAIRVFPEKVLWAVCSQPVSFRLHTFAEFMPTQASFDPHDIVSLDL